MQSKHQIYSIENFLSKLKSFYTVPSSSATAKAIALNSKKLGSPLMLASQTFILLRLSRVLELLP